MENHLRRSASIEPLDLPAIAGGKPIRPASATMIFGCPVIGDEEIEAVTECLRSRWIGLGPRVAQFERAFADYKGASYAAAVSSGSAALHLALLALGIGPGDEVISTSMTFCSTIHAIVHTGATPVLCDCDRRTLNLDPDQIERRITPRTRAILVVHMCGRCCDMDPILAIARRHGLRVIEDCAHAIESTWHGAPSGLMGDAGCFSFYATKNLTTADGGMVVTNNEDIARRVKRLSLHGMDADAWARTARNADGYHVLEPGFKYNMTDIEASLGLVQLARIGARWERREALWNLYNEQLRSLPVELPAPVEPGSRHAYHLYTIVLQPETLTAGRDAIVSALRAENIGTGTHYVPVHRQPYYEQAFGFRPQDFPRASWIGDNTLSLPLSAELTEADVQDVVRGLRRILNYYCATSNLSAPVRAGEARDARAG